MECKDIPGYEGYYQISDNGDVFSLNRTVLRRSFQMSLSGKKLKVSKTTTGYYYVNLNKNHAKNFKIHRLVAICFLENPNGYNVVNHKNGIKTDNRAANLEWCTKSHDSKEAIRIGLRKTKLDIYQVSQIRELSKTTKVFELKNQFKVHESTINRILNREIWNFE
jgi:hypothetical protein